MSRKLLHKTQRVYIVFSIVILIIVAPLFYYITNKLYIDDADEALLQSKAEFFQNSYSQFKETDIPVWNKFNYDIKISETKNLSKDTLFYSSYFDSLSYENEPYRELNSPVIINGKPYTFIARINLVESEDLITSIAILFLVLIVLLLLGLFIITKRLSFSVWKPFYETLQQIEQFEIDKNKQPKLLNTGIEEFNRLNKSIDQLIKKNTVIFQSQREFVENAAHELQTPIAIFKAKIDTLIQTTDLTKEQAEIIASLNKSVSRLSRLNKNLLLLSKIDNNQFSEVSRFSVNEIIARQFLFFTEQAQQQNIHIETELDTDITLSANEVLTDILFSNLFMNAIRHNVINGEIHLQLSKNIFTISNTGSPAPLSSEKLFSRFIKINPSKQGNGLGLAIVKKIADNHGWRVSYTYSNSHHSFSVQF